MGRCRPEGTCSAVSFRRQSSRERRSAVVESAVTLRFATEDSSARPRSATPLARRPTSCRPFVCPVFAAPSRVAAPRPSPLCSRAASSSSSRRVGDETHSFFWPGSKAKSDRSVVAPPLGVGVVFYFSEGGAGTTDSALGRSKNKKQCQCFARSSLARERGGGGERDTRFSLGRRRTLPPFLGELVGVLLCGFAPRSAPDDASAQLPCAATGLKVARALLAAGVVPSGTGGVVGGVRLQAPAAAVAGGVGGVLSRGILACDEARRMTSNRREPLADVGGIRGGVGFAVVWRKSLLCFCACQSMPSTPPFQCE